MLKDSDFRFLIMNLRNNDLESSGISVILSAINSKLYELQALQLDVSENTLANDIPLLFFEKLQNTS